MAKLNDITFEKQNGGMGRTAASEDSISGLIMLMTELTSAHLINASNAMQFDTIDSEDGENTLYAVKLRYTEELNDLGLIALKESGNVAAKALCYHVTEFFRMNETGTLYLMIRNAGTEIAATDIKQLQYYASGLLRQCGIFTTGITNLAAYQTACTELEAEHQPLSVVVAYAGKTISGETPTPVVTLNNLTGNTNYINAKRCNVSILVSCDLAGDVVSELGKYAYFGCIGLLLGTISKAFVHECIAYVAKFPLSLGEPGLISGELIKDVSVANQEKMNDNRYIFVRVHVGDANNYFNDSHTLDELTSDYAHIENVRTMDKAVRGVRKNLLPYLNSPLYVDATSGKLAQGTVAFLEITAGKALEDMEKLGELSGCKAEIDANQNVLATSVLEIVIKNVPVGVMRKVKVKIGFTTKLS